VKSPRASDDRGRDAVNMDGLQRHLRELRSAVIVRVGDTAHAVRCPKCKQEIARRDDSEQAFRPEPLIGQYSRTNRDALDHTNRRLAAALANGWDMHDPSTKHIFDASPVPLELKCMNCNTWYVINLRHFDDAGVAAILPGGLQSPSDSREGAEKPRSG